MERIIGQLGKDSTIEGIKFHIYALYFIKIYYTNALCTLYISHTNLHVLYRYTLILSNLR